MQREPLVLETTNMTRFRPNETPRARSFTDHAPAYKSPDALFASNQSHHLGNGHRLTFEFNLEDHIKKTRKAAAYMKQLHHTQSCGGMCMAQYCMGIAALLKHVQGCIDGHCIQPGCQTTRTLLEHSKRCKGRSVNGVNNLKNINNKDDDFCLMCTIAFANENGASKTPSFEDSHYDNRKVDSDDRTRPFFCDEIIEFNRVPFQSFMSPSPRNKTLSDSDFVVQHSSPTKKARSKSMTAATLNEVVI